MFYLSYLKAELFRRLGKTLTISLGLAIASAIIISIVSVSDSLKTSQEEVLNPLSSVGTDMMVTRTVSTENRQNIDETTREDLMSDNRVFTDLSALGNAGDAFKSDAFATGGNLSFATSDTANLDTSLVADSATALIMNVTHQEGTIPTITSTFRTGGQRFQISQDVQFTEEDMQAFRDSVRTGEGPPQRQVTTEFVVPEEEITQNVDIPETDIQTTNYTIAGVDTRKTEIGLILPNQVIEGSYFSTIPAPQSAVEAVTEEAVETVTTEAVELPKEAIVSQAYAQKQSIKVGDIRTISGKDLTVIGIVEPKLYTNTADVYVTLPMLQEMSGKTDRVNILLVKSTDAANIEASTTALNGLFTGATVTSAADTAKQVSGSLVSVSNLMSKFVGVVSWIVLIAAFIIVSLITLLSVNKRVREIGTLKAFGWSNLKIIRQILMENLVLGVFGAALGIGFAMLGIYVLNNLNLTLNADVSSLNSSLGNMVGRFMGGGGFGRGPAAAQAEASSDITSTVVNLKINYEYVTLLMGTLVAVTGSLFAGLLASFKASRMRPQEALRNLE